MKGYILALVTFVSLNASAQQSCYNQAAEINRGLDADSRLLLDAQRSSANAAQTANRILRLTYGLRSGQAIDLTRELHPNIDTIRGQVLSSRQAMYNIRSLLNDINNRSDTSEGVRAIVNNIVANNLGPAERSADSAMSGADQLKNQVTSINNRLRQGGDTVRIADQIDAEANLVGRETQFVERTVVKVDQDLGYTKRRVDDLARTCSAP
ncbi:MAG: hypothetical protein AB7F59_00405 [Bdellovibrionales bacterium]